jgi:Bacteriophage T4-like portal protein (Gp20)
MANNNKFSLFGFTISRQKNDDDQAVQPSFTPPTNDDGALTITSAAYYGTYVDLDGTAKNEVELISRYREMAMQPEIESAIDDIVGEAICQDDDGKNIKIVLDDLNQPEKIKAAIRKESSAVTMLMVECIITSLLTVKILHKVLKNCVTSTHVNYVKCVKSRRKKMNVPA